jgi:hypothetical protein
VEIIGTAQIVNEPCNCTGTFNAEVHFTVRNNAASDRGCITLHLVPVTLPDGSTFDPRDVLLQGSIAGKTTQTMTGFIQNYPCGAGLVCFGSPTADGRKRCDPGQCATVSWTVPGQDTCPPAKQISSKCRHQRICIQGRGKTTLDCDTGTDGVQKTCDVDCGGTTTLRLCTTSGADLGPFTFTLDGQTAGPTKDTCHDFTVGPITATTDFTGTVTDASGCAKSAKVTLNVTPIAPEIAVSGADNCDGKLTLTASVPGFDNCSFTWSDGSTGATLQYQQLDGTCHTISVSADCGGCQGTASETISQCVQTTVGCTVPGTAIAAPGATTHQQKHHKRKHKGPKKGKGHHGKGATKH